MARGESGPACQSEGSGVGRTHTLEDLAVTPESRTDRPLLHARRPVGRPRKSRAEPEQDPRPSEDEPSLRSLAVAPIPPRLLDLEATAQYLGVSPWTVRDLEAAGVLRRVRIPLANDGELRKLLFDREDLDHLISLWKDQACTAA